MLFWPLVGRVVIRLPEEELELEEELDEDELELDEEELELDELELLDEELELLEDELELDELPELEVPPQPDMTVASRRAMEPRATPLGNSDFGKAPIMMYLN